MRSAAAFDAEYGSTPPNGSDSRYPQIWFDVPVHLVGRDDHLGFNAWRVLDALKDVECA
jgi:hypothetical protein